MNRFLCLLLLVLNAALPRLTAAKEINLVQNSGFESLNSATQSPVGYELKGAATPGRVGRPDEFTTQGVIFCGAAPTGGSVAQTVHAIDPSKGRWLTFRFRGLAEDGFVVGDNALAMKIEFYSKNGTDYLDGVTRLIYREIENDRRDLKTNGLHHQHGAEVWRNYELEELIPFPEVDTVRISVIFEHGQAVSSEDSSFFVDDFSLVLRSASLTGKVDPATARSPEVSVGAVDETKLTPLGGRWYYATAEGESVPVAADGKSRGPLVVTEANADRLYYKSDRFINPFANNMTAWLRAGYKDESGAIVTKDRLVTDNVTLLFNGDGFLTVRSKNIPNHPTAQFPDTFGTQNYSPSYIQEREQTFRFPLEPVIDPDAKAVDSTNTNRALPMGPVGIICNGVVFYNPFDAGMRDASDLLDRCCGHPSPDNRYHYHKYPVCVNTPFVDKGDGPSQVIGFAFDGLPVYGPYEEAGIMAKDSTTNPLNAFNACYDAVRGWHYHVTPGKFPYIIGGYFAKVEPSNVERHPYFPKGGPMSFRPGFPWPPPPGGPPPPQ